MDLVDFLLLWALFVGRFTPFFGAQECKCDCSTAENPAGSPDKSNPPVTPSKRKSIEQLQREFWANIEREKMGR